MKRVASGPRSGSAGASRQTQISRIPLSGTARALLIALGGFLLLRGIVTVLHPPGLRLWGIDFAAWLPSTLLLHIALWGPLLFLLPQVSALFRRHDTDGSGQSSEGKRVKSGHRRLIRAALFTLAAGFAAWQVQVAYAFLGDGTWYAAELYRSMTLPDYANSMIKPSAWLTGILLDGFARMLRPDDIRLPFVLAGIAGMVIAAGAVLFSTRREPASVAFTAALLFLGGAGTLVFLGYIELYALVYALSIAYFVSAWQCLRGRGPLWAPILFLLLALLFGASAIAWLPSLLLLLHWKARGEGGGFPLPRAAVALMLLPVAAALAMYIIVGAGSDSAYLVAIAPYERVFEGLRTGWQRYVLLAPERWADLANMLLLGLGPVLFILPVLLRAARREGLLRRPAVLFGATAAAGGLTLLVFGNTFLGLARDWDVGAFALLGTAMLALVLWTEGNAHADRGSRPVPEACVAREEAGAWRRAVLPGLTAAIFSQLVLWIAVNTDEQVSAARFEALAAMDDGVILPMNSFTAWENLRKYYKSGNESLQYFRVLRRQIATGYRSHVAYAEYLSSLITLSDPARRREELSWLFDRFARHASRRGSPDDFRSIGERDSREFCARLLLTAWQIGEHDVANQYESRFRELFPVWSEAGLLAVLRGTGLDGAPSREEELGRIAAAVTAETRDAFLHMTAGGLYQQRGEYGKAAAAYEDALTREPSLYPSWYLVAAELHLRITGDTQKAREILERCTRNAGDSRESLRAAELLRQLQ